MSEEFAAAPGSTAEITTTVTGDAIAAGDATQTSVTAMVSTDTLGKKVVVTGEVTAIAVAEPGEDETVFTDATTDVFATGAYKVIVKTIIISGSNGEISTTTFKAIDMHNKEGELKIIYHIKEKDVDDIGIDPDGNVAIVSFDAQASGENTRVEVDAFALAIEDELSLSTLVIESAVG